MTSFRTPRGTLRAVDGLTRKTSAGKTVCIVGESGCGKSVTALSIMDPLPDKARIEAGQINFQGAAVAHQAHDRAPQMPQQVKIPDPLRRYGNRPKVLHVGIFTPLRVMLGIARCGRLSARRTGPTHRPKR